MAINFYRLDRWLELLMSLYPGEFTKELVLNLFISTDISSLSSIALQCSKQTFFAANVFVPHANMMLLGIRCVLFA